MLILSLSGDGYAFLFRVFILGRGRLLGWGCYGFYFWIFCFVVCVVFYVII
jgi:hypothetical protein